MRDWLEKYEELVNDINISYIVVRNYLREYIPSKVYRYRKFDDFWENNIFKGEVYLSNPNKFNDPFDSSVKIDELKFFKNYGFDVLPNFNEIVNNEEIKQEMSKFNLSTTDSFKNLFKIACFSEHADSILMWSHYADNHKGFCIEYNTQDVEWFEKLFLPVIYKNSRYDATNCLLTGSNNISINPLIYKSNVWQYENEWRIFTTNEIFDNDIVDMSSCISAIYLGAATVENDNIKKIESWGLKHNIPIHKMKLDNDEYKLIY